MPLGRDLSQKGPVATISQKVLLQRSVGILPAISLWSCCRRCEIASPNEQGLGSRRFKDEAAWTKMIQRDED